MRNFKEIIQETSEVPFNRFEEIQKGIKNYTPGTFGVEIEYRPWGLDVDLTDKLDYLDNIYTFCKKQPNIVQIFKSSYKPSQWKDEKLFELFIDKLYDSKKLVDLVEHGHISMNQYILDSNKKLLQSFLINNVNQKCTIEGDKGATKTTWNIVEDAEGLELQTRHLTLSDIDILNKVFDFIAKRGKLETDTSAHVHVGLPDNFNVFDILAMSILVDEKAITSVIKERNWSYAQLRSQIHKQFERVLPLHSTNKRHGDIYTDEEMADFLGKFDRYMGTNLRAYVSHRTVEYRYFASDILTSNRELFLKWIHYFLLLPKLAQSKTQFELKNIHGDKLTFTRMPNNKTQIVDTYKGVNIKVSQTNIPVSELRGEEISKRSLLPNKINFNKFKDDLSEKEKLTIFKDLFKNHVSIYGDFVPMYEKLFNSSYPTGDITKRWDELSSQSKSIILKKNK